MVYVRMKNMKRRVGTYHTVVFQKDGKYNHSKPLRINEKDPDWGSKIAPLFINDKRFTVVSDAEYAKDGTEAFALKVKAENKAANKAKAKKPEETEEASEDEQEEEEKKPPTAPKEGEGEK